MKYENGDEYNGEWKYGSKDGIGKMKYKKGDEYQGEFMCGQIKDIKHRKYRNIRNVL